MQGQHTHDAPAQALKRPHTQRTGRAHTDAAPSPYKRACARLPVRVGTRGGKRSDATRTATREYVTLFLGLACSFRDALPNAA